MYTPFGGNWLHFFCGILRAPWCHCFVRQFRVELGTFWGIVKHPLPKRHQLESMIFPTSCLVGDVIVPLRISFVDFFELGYFRTFV